MSLEVKNAENAKEPKYTLEFKQDAAKLLLEKGYTHQQAADCLEESLSALGHWVKAERNPTSVAGGKSQLLNLAEQNELTRLRKEIEPLRMERDIIKKAAVFFAKEHGQSYGFIRAQQKTYPITEYSPI
ncbi:MAG: hypothetical protein CTY24_02700 [Methylobacter sp.]|nr:MAG: hypothetical protein CTY24_02700 [Methylobacter sp.]